MLMVYLLRIQIRSHEKSMQSNTMAFLEFFLKHSQLHLPFCKWFIQSISSVELLQEILLENTN